MVHDLSIKYPNGSTIIYMDAFFPAKPAEVNKLWKTIMMTANFNDLLDRIMEHFKERDQNLKEHMYEAAAEVVRCKTEYEELKEQYRSRKRSNGRPIIREELPRWKKYVEEADKGWRSHNIRWKAYQKERKKLEQNKILLLKLSGRYDGDLEGKPGNI